MVMRHTFLVTLLIALAFSWFAGCSHFQKNKEHQDISDAEIQKGKTLAAAYCQDCHLLPDPSLLDAKTWEKGVLPYMGPFLGIFQHNFNRYPSSRYDRWLGNNFYPSRPMLSPGDWQAILDYYGSLAPDSLPGQDRKTPIEKDLTLFRPIAPSISYDHAATCYIKVDTSSFPHTLLLADVFRKSMYRFDGNLNLKDSVYMGGPVVDLTIGPSSWLACNMGIMNPNDGKFGTIQYFTRSKKGRMEPDPDIFFDSLARPVGLLIADLNQDGLTDYVICEFGNMRGALSWMENLGNGKFKRRLLRQSPGAIKAYINDYNHDGLPDLWVLFAQGDEGIFLFTNLGHGKFRQQELLRFPPAFGSSSFELADFNKDGFADIVYTCGDNGDYSQILKPYHGVYIFLNDGHNHFTQKYFYPINGCYKAMARDFNGDGNLDLATISFFADYARQPEEGFVYLENKGNFNFQPHTTVVAENGRWLTMDVGDLDGDGKPDILLGNFSVGPSFIHSKTPWTKSPPFLFLKNVGK
jgi:hypothetical protein